MTDARQWGVQRQYYDASGRLVDADSDTVASALRALGAEDRADPHPPRALFLHPGDRVDHPLEVVTEDGRSVRIEGTVAPDTPLGYHRLDGDAGVAMLVISPRRCHLPAGVHLGGWAVQVYGARSEASWGIGDLADLRTFGQWASAAGTGFALLSPLNAAAPSPPIEPSPYLPSSRRWRNPLFLRVEDVPGAEVLGDDLERIARAGHALNADRIVDRDAVAILKLDALTRIAEASPLRAAFTRWRRAQGEALQRFAVFSVIAEQHGGDFRQWPEGLRDPAAPAVRGLARRSRARVAFHAWLQWLLEQQLASAATAIPLISDLPIGVDPGGADVWADRDLFATDFSVGAPPDLFNKAGQDWAQPPWNPWTLRARAYQPLVEVFRAGFSHAMGLRIDHVMGLFRLYWIPRGGSPANGVFVRYPTDDMLDILALESVRAGALVVGEDLGTVEPLVREEMAARDILSYRLLWFEDEDPSRFPEHAMSAVTTHDLPTVAGVWRGADVEAQRSIGIEVNEAGTAEIRGRLARVAGDADSTAEVILSAYSALAGSPSMLVVASLEDAAEVEERPNMPGTTGERWPNWCLSLPRSLEEVLASRLAERLAAIPRRD
ncbi:MAG TPA: 4-alpha-glucanotransferase [Candidatus Deferrimicrobium sp.]|nr:4-alpha-glucanotransferase [Candidatus Deferrimicrobium sp.]